MTNAKLTEQQKTAALALLNTDRVTLKQKLVEDMGDIRYKTFFYIDGKCLTTCESNMSNINQEQKEATFIKGLERLSPSHLNQLLTF